MFLRNKIIIDYIFLIYNCNNYRNIIRINIKFIYTIIFSLDEFHTLDYGDYIYIYYIQNILEEL